LPTFAGEHVFHVVVESPRDSKAEAEVRDGPSCDVSLAAGIAAESITDRVRRELEEFFFAATALEEKDVRTLNWADVDAALELVRRATL
jgi:hypothetical protein